MPDETPTGPAQPDPRDDDRTLTHLDGERPDHAASTEYPGQVMNQYTLVRLLGEGGFGAVWLAEQHEPVRRQVALKIIKLGMDTRQVIARFEAERQALAVLDHPNIAKVFDAGSTDAGRPYFVMEYTEGVTFTRYCDKHALSVRERLRLFQKVCHAVQHAHQKGIIHRDIKPGNVLVTEVDGEPTPKVIDFGIAKATENPLTEHTMFTEQGQIIGTPAYMSPEQTGLSSVDIDTRSDVYALGVLLYEAMTGETPFATKTLLSAGMDEIRRIIREVEPPKPSTRLSKTGQELSTVAVQRDTEPRRLSMLLTGDIDWIVMKAIEKDRGRRYQTATGFAEDIERFLSNEPVLASPPSVRYRTGKFVRRNKRAVIAAGLVLAALLAGTAGTSIGFVQATNAAAEARVERDKAEHVAVFLTDMLEGVGAQVAQGADTVLMRGILDKTATRVGDELAEQPEIEAEIRTHLGETYLQLRDFDRAEENLVRARDLYRSLANGDDRDVATSLGNFGQLRYTQERHEEAAALHREALAMWQRLDPEDATLIPSATIKLANTHVRLEEYPEAEELLLRALESLQADGGENHEVIGVVYNSLANLKQQLEDYEGAEGYYHQALALHRASLGDAHPFVATDLHNLGNLLSNTGRNKEAIELHEQALALCRTLYPEGHEMTASSLAELALLYRYDDDRSHEAPGMLEEAIALQSRLYGEASSQVAFSHRRLGNVLAALGDYEGAADEHQLSAALYEALYGEEDSRLAVSLQILASTQGTLGRYDEAEATFDRVLEIQTALYGDAHVEVAITLISLGAVHRQAQNYEAAEEAILEALTVFEAAGRGRTAFAASAYENLGRVYRALDRIDESADVLRQALEIRRGADGPNARGTLGASYALAGTLIDIEAFDEAETLLLHVLDDPDGVINARIRTAVQRRHADLLFAMERYDDCAHVLEECYRAYSESGASDKAGEVLAELVRASERRHAIDATPANDAATTHWRQLLDEQG